jgi:hypothetical protein
MRGEEVWREQTPTPQWWDEPPRHERRRRVSPALLAASALVAGAVLGFGAASVFAEPEVVTPKVCAQVAEDARALYRNVNYVMGLYAEDTKTLIRAFPEATIPWVAETLGISQDEARNRLIDGLNGIREDNYELRRELKQAQRAELDANSSRCRSAAEAS